MDEKQQKRVHFWAQYASMESGRTHRITGSRYTAQKNARQQPGVFYPS